MSVVWVENLLLTFDEVSKRVMLEHGDGGFVVEALFASLLVFFSHDRSTHNPFQKQEEDETHEDQAIFTALSGRAGGASSPHRREGC